MKTLNKAINSNDVKWKDKVPEYLKNFEIVILSD